MTTINPNPYLPFEDTRKINGIEFSKDFDRLYWPIKGSFPAALSVMKTTRGALEEMEPLLRPDGSLHEVLSQSLTVPKISSIDISIRMLDQYESDWVAWHEEDNEAEFVTYGDIDEETRPLGHSDTKYLARCCGQDRPIGKRGLKLHVTPSPGNEFVTVYDYVSAAHPWLVSLREDIMQAMVVVNPGPIVTPASVHATELMVSPRPAPCHYIDTKAEWLKSHKPLTPLDPALRRLIQSAGRGMNSMS